MRTDSILTRSVSAKIAVVTKKSQLFRKTMRYRILPKITSVVLDSLIGWIRMVERQESEFIHSTARTSPCISEEDFAPQFSPVFRFVVFEIVRMISTIFCNTGSCFLSALLISNYHRENTIPRLFRFNLMGLKGR